MNEASTSVRRKKPWTANSWAQAADVLTYTGETVTDAQVMQAQAIIDMFTARTYDALPRIGTRDLYWLKLATAYQSAWMLAQPDMYSRLDFATISAGSRPVELKGDTLRIAPLAAKAVEHQVGSQAVEIGAGATHLDAAVNGADAQIDVLHEVLGGGGRTEAQTEEPHQLVAPLEVGGQKDGAGICHRHVFN